MHFFRPAPLADALSRRDVSVEEQAKYLLAGFVAFIVFYYSGLAASTAQLWTLPSIVEGLVLIGINAIGVVKAFDAAGGKDNPDFVLEFTCLYVPVSVSTYLVVWVSYWLILWGFGEAIEAFSYSNMQFALNLARIGTNLQGFLTFSACVLAVFVSYRRLCSLLARVQSAKAGA